jgi:hypothetical protein
MTLSLSDAAPDGSRELSWGPKLAAEIPLSAHIESLGVCSRLVVRKDRSRFRLYAALGAPAIPEEMNVPATLEFSRRSRLISGGDVLLRTPRVS